jgi:RNA polymerase sigma-70 factor, ECF subfamily
MLGSLHDAEDVVQESLVRACQRLDEVRSPEATRAWLYRIATNACLDFLKTRRRRSLPHLLAPASPATSLPGPPAHEGMWVEPAPDALLKVVADDEAYRPDARVSVRESIGLAFITALQLLPAKQRAVLLLIDVLGWKPQETAQLLESTVASVNSLLQRARRRVDDTRDATPIAEDPALVQRYIHAWESGDLSTFTALLAEDARLSMPPLVEWYAGRAAIRQFLANVMTVDPRDYRLVATRANGGPAIAIYARSGPDAVYQASAITVLTLRGGYISEMTRFSEPRLFASFGLPATKS